MKVLVMTSKKRVEKYTDLEGIPKEFELIYLDYGYSEEQVLSVGRDADFIFVDAVNPVSRYVIENMKNLKLIHSEGVGYNKIDIQAAKEAGKYVCNNAALNSRAVAEQAILLMLGLLRRLVEGDYMVRIGEQAKAKSSFILDGIRELGECHVGIIGFGNIGKETAKLLVALGSKVSYYSNHRLSPKEEESYKVSYLPLKELTGLCDILSLHLPVTPLTNNFVDKEFLQDMKKDAILINTARGELINQESLLAALKQGIIAGAGLDTLYPEPVLIDNPLLNLPEEIKYKILFSPHIGGTTNSVFYKMHQNVWKNILAASKGQRPANIVN